MTETQTERSSTSAREQELREIETILESGTYAEYKQRRDRIQYFKKQANFTRFPILAVYEKMYQNEVDQKGNNFEGLSPYERGLVEERIR